MPLGISPSVRLSGYVQLHCGLVLTAMSFRPLYSYNTTASRKFSFILFPTMNKIRRAIPSAGIRTPFSLEYKGRTAYVNKNLGSVRKAEQRRRVIGITRPMHLGTASGVERPLVSSNYSSAMT
jgi:hypothetical protein